MTTRNISNTKYGSILCKTITKWRVVATRVSVAITVCKQSWVGNVSRNHVTSLVVYIRCHSWFTYDITSSVSGNVSLATLCVSIENSVLRTVNLTIDEGELKGG